MYDIAAEIDQPTDILEAEDDMEDGDLGDGGQYPATLERGCKPRPTL